MSRQRPRPERLVGVDGVTYAYTGAPVLIDVSLDVGRGDYVGIVGPSGAGKSTLLRLLLGTLEPQVGAVECRAGARIGYVPQAQTVNWNFPVTVAEVVLMARPRAARRLLPWASREERLAVGAALERLGIGELSGRHIHDLSGGQQQRVFIARALVRQPHLLVMDEPTSGIDVRSRHELLHLLAELHGDGLTVVLTTHDLNGLASHLPRLVCLNRRVMAEGTPLEVLTPAVLEATYGAPLDVLEHAGMPVVIDSLPAAATGTGTAAPAPSVPEPAGATPATTHRERLRRRLARRR